MILTRERTYGTYLIIEIEGRIDGLTSSTLKKTFERVTEDGHHRIVVDFSAVSYISSAGLRVFLQMQKKLIPVGGEIILLAMQAAALDVFRVSGLLELFRTFSELPEIGDATRVQASEDSSEMQFFSEDKTFQWQIREVADGKYSGIGNSSKLRTSSFNEKDIVTLSQNELQYAVGLASIGESIKDYQSLFGESLMIDHHYFGYPAVEQPAVDYSWYSQTHPGDVHFLYGFRFSGEFRVCLRFDSSSSLELLSIARKFAEITGKDFFGIVIAGKSTGIYGLSLRKIPWEKHSPDPPDIMNDSSFPNWFDFPVEDTDINQTVVSAGIYSKSGSEEELHMHGVIFSKGFLSKSGMDLHKEINRILQGSEPLRVVHLLEESKLCYGLAGIITF